MLGVWHGVPFLFDDGLHLWRRGKATGEHIGSLFFPFVIATLLWLNNSHTIPRVVRNRLAGDLVLGSALLLYAYLAFGAVAENHEPRTPHRNMEPGTRNPEAVQLSVLDLVPVRSGSTASDALRESVDLARAAERLGYRRYWFAEHHSMPSIGSSAPEILIEHIASATGRIRVGSGGIMLPNHAPLRVAELFHTLEALHPGRIDLGVGRAPGTDPAASRALRPFDADRFPDQLRELQALSARSLPAHHPFASVRVIPDDVALPPIWVLASSGATAAMAGSMGLGYGFARHFSLAPPGPAIRAYRDSFTASAAFPRPHVILGVAVVCAPTDAEAEYLASSTDLAWVRRHHGVFAPLPSPEEAANYPYSPQDRSVLEANRLRQIVGGPATVAGVLREVVAGTSADELMVTTMVFGRDERLRSYELLAAAWGI